MNFAVPFHEGDKDQAQRWLSWVEELGGMGRHRLWLMPVKGLTTDFKTGLPFEVIKDGSGIRTDWSKGDGEVRDAAGANSMIRQLCWHFYLAKAGAWTFMEPDAIPLREGWHDAWEDEYNQARKHFMGALVPGKPGQYPDHLTGVAVYSERTVELSKLMMLPTHAKVDGSERIVELAFDVAAAPDILKQCHRTKLIQHVFRGPPFTDIRDLGRIDREAVIWHSDKDGGLIKLLRAKRQGSSVVECHQDDGVKAVASDAGSIPAPVAKPKVHTYFRPCVDAAALEEQKRILAIWESNWREAGWEPVILTEVHARQHPDFQKYYEKFHAIPTANPKEYEMACWLRWLAMLQIGGGMMVDYDVLNNGWEMPKWALDPDGTAPFIYSTNNPVPCAVSGCQKAFGFAVSSFAAAKERFVENGAPHVSDQLLIQAWKWPSGDICRQVGSAGWQDAKLIHFCHAACGQERSLSMKAWTEKQPNLEWENSDAPVIETNLGVRLKNKTVMDEIRERLVWIKDNSPGIRRHYVHRELKALGLLPKK